MQLKNKRLLLMAAFVLCTLATPTYFFAQDNKEAFKYLERIMSEKKRVLDKCTAYSNLQIHSKDPKAVRLAHTQATGQIQIAINNLTKVITDYKGDGTLRKKNIKLYEALLHTYKNDYEKMFALAKTSEESVETMEAYLQLQGDANEKASRLFDTTRAVIREFAAEHNINILEDDDTALKKFNAAMDKVGKYRKGIFMQHFRLLKAAAPAIDDLNKNKGKKLGDFAAPLQKTCEDVLLKLKELGAYENDNALNKIVQKEAEYYLEQSKKNMPEIAALLQKKSLESQKEVDTLNKWTKDFVTHYNDFSTDYAEGEDRLWDKHVPVYKISNKP